MSEVVLTRRAERDLGRLETRDRRRVIAALREMATAPLAQARKLTDSRIGTYRIRVGDFRIIFDIERDTVVILRIGHRREIYRD